MGIGRPSKTPIFVTAVTIGTYSDSPVPLGMRPLLGAILAERGLIDPERLAEALAEAQATHQRVGEVLLRKGWLYEQELARALAHQYELEYVDLETACVNPRDAALLDPAVGQRCRAVPISFAGDELVVAIADPAPHLVDELRARLPYPLRLVVAEPSLVERAWDDLLSGRRG
jgi:type IV pilus assembly protein PilB